jgi:pimeloyl-ACP methyl ester carboxylesterase
VEGTGKSFKDYHLIIPDLPEHGKSANIKPFTIKTAAGLVINIIKTLAHQGEAHLVGIGMGGQLVLEILDRAPELVDRVMISGVQTSSHQKHWLSFWTIL